MKVFTTGQVAKICKVAPRTVSKWFDSGRLKGYRIPGSQDRRIPREYLIKFLKEHGMPLGDLEDEAMAKVLIVAQDQVLIENLKRELPLERSFKVAVAASGFDAGIQAESFHPDCIIVDFSIGRTEALQICQNLRRNSEFAEVILIALLPDDGSSTSFDRSSINETFKKPFDAALLGRATSHADRCQEGARLRYGSPTGSILESIPISPVRLTRRGMTPAADNFPTQQMGRPNIAAAARSGLLRDPLVRPSFFMRFRRRCRLARTIHQPMGASRSQDGSRRAIPITLDRQHLRDLHPSLPESRRFGLRRQGSLRWRRSYPDYPTL